MRGVELLEKAINYQRMGRKMEAIKLYADGISELMIVCKAEPNLEKQKHYRNKISEYMDHAERLKEQVQQRTIRGEIRDKYHIVEGVKGYGYDKVFGKYLDEHVVEINIEEPYLRDFYQLVNLVKFCELAVQKCTNLKYICVTTGQDTRPNSEQQKGFNSLRESLQERHVFLNFEYSDHIHDRQVFLSNGFIIKIGRGLNYFKGTPNKFSLGTYDYNLRECRETNIDILYSPEIKK